MARVEKPMDRRRARAEAGELDAVVAELTGLCLEPGSDVDSIWSWLEELKNLAPEQLSPVRERVDRERRPWVDVDLGEGALHRLEEARSQATAWKRWPLGTRWFQLHQALEAVACHDPQAARDLLAAVPAAPELAELRARVEQALAEPSASGAPDLGALEQAWRKAKKRDRPEAGARYGLALMEAGEQAKAWKPLENAAMGLGHAHAMTKSVFAALDVLEKAGYAE